MSKSFNQIEKRLADLEAKLRLNKLIKPRYYLHEAQDTLCKILGERLLIWDVLDIANEANQSLWLDLSIYIPQKDSYKLISPQKLNIKASSIECSTNPFLYDLFTLDTVDCIYFANEFKVITNGEKVIVNKTIPQHVYLDRDSMYSIIACFS